MTRPESPQPSAEHCVGPVCLTCADQAEPGRVLQLRPDRLALVDFDGTTDEVSVALVTAGPGDTVLVHAGEAIAVLNPTDEVKER